MRFDIITLFPRALDGYFKESLIARAQEKKLIDVRIHDLRRFASGRRRQTDDRPYGGGPGMVLKIEPLVRTVRSITQRLTKSEKRKTLVVLLSAGGAQFDARKAHKFAKKYSRLVFICGHYEGFDERIFKIVRAMGCAPLALSVGPYVLTGGEAAAMIVADAVARHIPGVLGKKESLEEMRYGAGLPAYTRPEVFEYGKKKYRVPKILLSGDHGKIDAWRRRVRRG